MGWREFSKGGKLKLAFTRNWDSPIPPPASEERREQGWHLKKASHVSDLWDLPPPTTHTKTEGPVLMS